MKAEFVLPTEQMLVRGFFHADPHPGLGAAEPAQTVPPRHPPGDPLLEWDLHPHRGGHGGAAVRLGGDPRPAGGRRKRRRPHHRRPEAGVGKLRDVVARRGVLHDEAHDAAGLAHQQVRFAR